MANRFDYLLQFPDAAAAQRDSIVGPYFPAAGGTGVLEAIVFADMTVDSVDALPGYWPMITTAATPALQSHPNIMLVIDDAAQRAGQPSVVLANIPIAHVGIMVNGFGNYVANGLQFIG
jgi:hypothetical protein